MLRDLCLQVQIEIYSWLLSGLYPLYAVQFACIMGSLFTSSWLNINITEASVDRNVFLLGRAELQMLLQRAWEYEWQCIKERTPHDIKKFFLFTELLFSLLI